jgi:hypothetical protein
MSLTKRNVLLFWALAEALSPRWRHVYKDLLNPKLAAALGIRPLKPLTPEMEDELIALLRQRRKAHMDKYIDPASGFMWIQLPPLVLEKLHITPSISFRDYPVTLGDFIKGQYDAETWHDPRNAARRMLEMPEDVPFYGYPIFAWDKKIEAEVLIDGYARCIEKLYRIEAGEVVSDVQAILCVR